MKFQDAQPELEVRGIAQNFRLQLDKYGNVAVQLDLFTSFLQEFVVDNLHQVGQYVPKLRWTLPINLELSLFSNNDTTQPSSNHAVTLIEQTLYGEVIVWCCISEKEPSGLAWTFENDFNRISFQAQNGAEQETALHQATQLQFQVYESHHSVTTLGVQEVHSHVLGIDVVAVQFAVQQDQFVFWITFTQTVGK